MIILDNQYTRNYVNPFKCNRAYRELFVDDDDIPLLIQSVLLNSMWQLYEVYLFNDQKIYITNDFVDMTMAIPDGLKLTDEFLDSAVMEAINFITLDSFKQDMKTFDNVHYLKRYF